MREEYSCEIKEEPKRYKIGMFSRMNRVTVKALRHYDEIGLLKPESVDEGTGYRYYTSAQLPLLHQIIALRDMGFTLEEIRSIKAGNSEREMLAYKKQQVLKEIAEKTAKLAKIESYLASERKECHIVIKELPEVTVASMRTVMEDYSGLFSLMPMMGGEMERLGCTCAEPEYCFNIYHDGGYREEEVDVEICESVTEKRKDSDLIQFKVIPGVKTAVCALHRGPYGSLPETYMQVVRHIEENDYEIIGNARESYIDGVWNKDSEEDWLTEVQFPVRID